MGYGVGEYGQRGYGGASQEAGGPSLVVSDPLNGSNGISTSAPVSFTVSSPAGLDEFSLNVDLDGSQAIVGGVFQSGFGGTITYDPETQVVVEITTHPLFAGGSTDLDISITDLTGNSANINVNWISVDNAIVPETVTVGESLSASMDFAPSLSETVTVGESLSVVQSIAQVVSETVSVTEALQTGSLLIVAVAEDTIRVDFPVELAFNGVGNLSNFLVQVVTPGASPVRLRVIEPSFTTYQSGSNVYVVDTPFAQNQLFDPAPVFGEPGNTSNVIDFDDTAPFTDSNIGDYIQILNGKSAGVYQIVDVYLTNAGFDVAGPFVPRVVLDRPLVVNDPQNGYVEGAVEIVTAGSNPIFRLDLPSITALDPLLEILFLDNRTQGVSKTLPTLFREDAITFVDHNTFQFNDVVLDTFPVAAGDRVVVKAKISSKLDWVHISGVQSLTFKTRNSPGTILTEEAVYSFSGKNLFTKQPKTPFSFSGNFQVTAGVVQKPRVIAAEFVGDEGNVVVTYDEAMRLDDANLGNLVDYAITGPTTVSVKNVQVSTSNQVVLKTSGLGDGTYTLTVSTSTPTDTAGNPIDPLFNTAIFTSMLPLSNRSIYTDKGPIARPPLTVQTGAGATIETHAEVTLTGATLTSSEVGLYVTLSGGSTNGGTFRIAAVLTSERVRLANASFTLPDVTVLAWEVFDPRNGQIADDSSDVVVRINGSPVTPDAVIGLLGQIVLSSAPLESDTVEVDYSWVCNPVVEIRRLNSKEFRFNSWNRDTGYAKDPSQHHYRFNNVLTTPSEYTPLNLSAPLDQPVERELHYRAYERAYTAVLNDPTLLLFNSPIHRIAFPSARRTVSEEFVPYEGVGLPEANVAFPWEREGAGQASSASGVLTVQDDSTGTFPAGEPVFWKRALDLTFDHVFAMTWRFSLDVVTTFEGVFTGVATGYSDNKNAVIVGFLEDAGVKKIGFAVRGGTDDPSEVGSWVGGFDASDVPTDAPVEFDWSVLHSYRIFRDLNGTVTLFVDGDTTPSLRITPSELPFLEELNAPFDTLQGAFFGSVSRPAESTSTWDFVRYLISPTNPVQTAPSSFVSYEANVAPEIALKPWTPVGFHGTSTILSTDFLLLDSTSATDTTTADEVGLVGGDYRGYFRFEPLLTSSSEFVLDGDVQLQTHTHGVSELGLMMAVDDGARVMQLCFFPDFETPKLSYGGRSLPEDFSPYVWSSMGGETAELVGRILRITDAAGADGKVYFIEDTAPTTLTFASGTLGSLLIGSYPDGSTVTIDGKTYTFQTTLTDVDGNVQLGGTNADSWLNLQAAINLTGTPGVDYAASTTLHPSVTATGTTGASITLQAKVGGPSGNFITVSTDIPAGSLDTGATLAGGSTGDERVIASVFDYILESRFQVNSYTVDGSGFAGAFMQAFDGTRAVGLLLEEVGGVKRVAFHSDGVVISSAVYDWGSGFHTYRLRKSTSGDLVSLFIDGVFVGSEAYSNFTAPPPDPIGLVSFGSSTPASAAAQSVVDWAYCNAWRVRNDQKTYVGLWKGTDSDSLLGYHLPLKTSGKGANVAGNAMGDGNADFIADGIASGDHLVVDAGANRGVYKVVSVINGQNLTINGSWPSAPSLVDYRIIRETDWTTRHRYRLFRDATGTVSVFFDSDPLPIIQVGYNSIDIPASGSGVVRTISNNLPAMVFGSFDPENLAQSNWDFVRYGITTSVTERRIAPHHQFLNQQNVMASPEHLFTSIAHAHTNFQTSSTGIPPKQDPDFMEDSGLIAFTILNEGTPLVPSTQTFEVRAPFPVQEFVSGFNKPEDVLNNDGDFVLNDGSVRFKLIVPNDVLYSCLDTIEQTDDGVTSLITPFDDSGCDRCGPTWGTLFYQEEVCLEYDGAILPELDMTAPTPWELVSDAPGEVSTSAFSGILTYTTSGVGTRTVYRNNSPLPDAPSLQTEARFRMRVLQDSTLGTADSQIRIGMSAPNMTVALGFVTTPLAERYVLVLDLNNGAILGSATFDYLDGAFHTYRIVRDPSAGSVSIFIDS